MKVTHYDYKSLYFSSTALAKGKYKRKMVVASQLSQINLDHEYHTTWVNVYTDDMEIESLDLGVDYSPPKFILKNRSMDRLFLNFIIKGKGRINGESFSAGQFYYTLPNEVHTIEADADTPYVSVWISLTGMYTQYVVSELNKKSKKRLMPLERRKEVMELTKTFLHSINLGETTLPYLKAIVDIYLSYITSNDNLEISDAFATEKIAKLIKESKSYIKKNLKYVTVADMAAAQHYNKKYFSRVFTEAMGITPSEYITDCKLEWAKNSLAYSELSVEEITEAIGYEHRNGLAIAFKKKYGCTPSEYRKKIKREPR